MRNVALALVMGVLASACGDEQESAFAYGPCDNGKCGLGPALQSSDGTCLCALSCHVGEECPQPSTGDVEAICMDQGDVVSNGYDGRCDLPCADGDTCPDDAECVSGYCRYSTSP